MTSKQVTLIVASGLLAGCTVYPREAEPLSSPYAARRIFALAPLSNESGSLQADGLVLADHLARQLENASQIDVLPVNRTLAAMQARRLGRITGPDEALRLIRALGADALVVGTISAFDPYDPPKLGVALELYFNSRGDSETETLDLRELTRSTTGGPVRSEVPLDPRRPASAVSHFFDAADPRVRRALSNYAIRRGNEVDDGWSRFYPVKQAADKQRVSFYRISMDLFSEFVSYEMSWRLLQAEARRLLPAEVAQANP